MKTTSRRSLGLYLLTINIIFTGLIRGSGVTATDIFSDTNYFPIAVWLQSPSNAAAYKGAGVNLFVGLWEGPTKADLDELLSAGMPAICDQNEFALANLDAYRRIIAGWMHMDEPDNAQSDGSGGYGPCLAPDTIINRYAVLKARDPSRPVYLNLGQGVSHIEYIGRGSACSRRTDMYPRYIQGCDIVSYDIYPVNSEYAAVKGNLWYVAKGIDSLRMWSGDAKEAWCWIECTRIDSSSTAAPTPDQVKAEVWMALIHGAKGFGYFCHSWYGGFKEAGWLNNAQMKKAITDLNARISSLAPVLNSPSVTGKVIIESDAPSVPIDIMVKSRGNALYIFAAAMGQGVAKGSFLIAGVNEAATVEVMDENRTIALTDGKFKDDFNGYGVHLYKVILSSGTREQRSRKTYSRPGSSGLIPVIQGNPISVSANLKIDESAGTYNIQGKFLAHGSKFKTGRITIPDGICVVRREWK